MTIRGGYGIFYAPIDFQIDYVVQALNEIDGKRQIAQVLSVLNASAPTADRTVPPGAGLRERLRAAVQLRH